jgi:parvulin-like peptidyl-prolyl isomerase
MSLESTYLKVADHELSLGQVLAALRLRGVWDRAISDLTRREILLAYAAKQGVGAADEELQGAVDGWRRMNNLVRAEQTQAWLDNNGLTLDDLERDCEARIVEMKLMSGFDRTEIEAIYTERQTDFHAANLVMVRTADEAQANELKAKLEADPKALPALVDQYCSDEELKQQHGHIGWVRRPAMKQHLAEAVFAAQPGAVVGPFEAGTSRLVYRVEQISKPQLNDWLETEIRRGLLNQKLAESAPTLGVQESPFWRE